MEMWDEDNRNGPMTVFLYKLYTTFFFTGVKEVLYSFGLNKERATTTAVAMALSLPDVSTNKGTGRMDYTLISTSTPLGSSSFIRASTVLAVDE